MSRTFKSGMFVVRLAGLAYPVDRDHLPPSRPPCRHRQRQQRTRVPAADLGDAVGTRASEPVEAMNRDHQCFGLDRTPLLGCSASRDDDPVGVAVVALGRDGTEVVPKHSCWCQERRLSESHQ